MAFLPIPTPVNWLFRAAAKVQAAAYRNAKYKYKKQLENLIKENESLKNSRASIISDYRDLVNSLKCFDDRIITQEANIAAIRVPDTPPLQPPAFSFSPALPNPLEIDEISSQEVIHPKVIHHHPDLVITRPSNVPLPPVDMSLHIKNKANTPSLQSASVKVAKKKRPHDEFDSSTNNQISVPPSIPPSIPPVIQPPTALKSPINSLHKRKKKKRKK